MSKVLIIIIGQLRATNLTYSNICDNLINKLNADLCVCTESMPNTDYSNNNFTLKSKYVFNFNKPLDYTPLFDDYYNKIIKKNNITDNINWKKLLELEDDSMGPLKFNSFYNQRGSGWIIINLYSFLIDKLLENDLINKYDRFIITRSDFIYRIEHPSLDLLDGSFIWLQNGEHHGGLTNRHTVLSRSNVIDYLNVFENIIINLDIFYNKLQQMVPLNIEKYLLIHLEIKYSSKIRFFPYIMFIIRNADDPTNYKYGEWNDKYNTYVKYKGEYCFSRITVDKFNFSNLTIDKFYGRQIKKLNRSEILFRIINQIKTNKIK